ncbi:NAD(P)-dependent alcohol dehydrogenase [Aurantiacibacter spongiae]|uniref:NAD(P)-dependent alcohol dehydrogenase n=1 Tax=Aurantiacibacter spongiae TaxID=2488860 RepID=A0A3N5DMM2_9SPHN|nr:NAD(P)-dependent alcohol dehydrogenase [Aurantiacibacter spongiae]RPF72135.1 NAD(P)-dependent alcohol dehydrogenase [Aurantiacibacter spongiae]
MQVIGFGAKKAGKDLVPMIFDRQNPRAGEVAIDITHCGVCHSDLHQVNDDWGNTVWPCIPGHEIVGTVTHVGEGVSKFSVGDTVGVGCMVNSCQECEQCRMGEEQYCTGPRSVTLTYNGPKKPDGTNTYGGYSTAIIVREEFVLAIPDKIDPRDAAPILCAGITTYQPMKYFGLKEGQVLGVAGIGGLGHMAIQIGKAMGAKVIALTTSKGKKPAAEVLGADEVIVMKDKDALEKHAKSMDLIVNTIPYKHDLNPYIALVKEKGTIAVVGNFLGFDDLDTATMVFNHVGVAGSLIGGIADTREVLEMCAEHDIRPVTELIEMRDIQKAFKRMKKEDVKFRHVIDMATLKNDLKAEKEAIKVDDPVRGVVTG